MLIAALTLSVTVLYAGSLVTPMEGPISHALATRGIAFEGESRGSKELANLIIAGLRKPDVVIVVDPSVLHELESHALVAHSWLLGSASLGISTSLCHLEPRRGKRTPTAASCLHKVFSTPGLRIARTDPRLDPKGRYTVEAMQMLLGKSGEQRLLGADDNPAQIFPEEDLLVRLETGEADVGFLYSTEARARHLPFIPLPGAASLSNKIRYYVAVMKNAPHPAAARAFVDFLLHGEGHTILEHAGLTTLR